MEPGKDVEHLLSLKVMRLSKPSLDHQMPMYFDERNLCGGQLEKMFARKTSVNPSPQPSSSSPTPVSSQSHISRQLTDQTSLLLKLPQTFGSIYLGETFVSYLCVHNESTQTCTNIRVAADLQTHSQRIALVLKENYVAMLAPATSVDNIICHEVKEIGDKHLLSCSVTYTNERGEELFFRKFFRFPVKKPVDIKTNFFNAQGNDVLFEATITNNTDNAIYMERVAFEAAGPHFTSENLNHIQSRETEKILSYVNRSLSSSSSPLSSVPPTPAPVYGELESFKSNQSRQYLYKLSCKKGHHFFITPTNKGLMNFGKLDMAWRTSMGERGRLQTSQLQRPIPNYGDLRMVLIDCPSNIQHEIPFHIQVELVNFSEQSLSLTTELVSNVNESGIYWCQPVSGQTLRPIEKQSSLTLTLTLIATYPGYCMLNGLYLREMNLEKRFQLEEPIQVYVS